MKMRTAQTSITASVQSWTVMFCITLLERIYEGDRERALSAIAAFFGWKLTK